ncbi:MAG: crossover junction endodeoxyribonuclease RuvC [Oscillospiraceae bacterium]|nr:crossover junction endodeoxyribonuclease RuvC [Oscillospiraceae bacterium]
MRILGIDPGYAIVGYGVLDYDKSVFSVVNYGAITTEAGVPFDKRLTEIYDDMCSLLDMFKPDCMSIERLYFTNNKTTGIDVAQARGVIMLAAAQRNIEIYEYTPLQVKQSVVGYGRAEKHQVQEMVKNILRLKECPRPDDTADAVALAICHGHSSGSALSRIIAMEKGKKQ